VIILNHNPSKLQHLGMDLLILFSMYLPKESIYNWDYYKIKLTHIMKYYLQNFTHYLRNI